MDKAARDGAGADADFNYRVAGLGEIRISLGATTARHAERQGEERADSDPFRINEKACHGLSPAADSLPRSCAAFSSPRINPLRNDKILDSIRR
jgi:hypothetical protein